MSKPFYGPETLKLVMAGERAGKSYTGGTYGVAQHMYDLLTRRQDKYLIWVAGWEYSACMPEFETMVEHFKTLGVLKDSAVRIRDNGRDYSFFTTDTGLTVETIAVAQPHKIARVAPELIIGCEVASWTEEAFLRVIGRLAEKRGRLWASGSFETSYGWLVDVWNRWQGDNDEGGRSYSIPSHTNRIVFPGGETDPAILQRKALYPEHLFAQRFLGIPARPTGLVFTEFDPKVHISDKVEFDPDRPVELWIDPGYNTAYAIEVVQVYDNTVFVIDELYAQGFTSHEAISAAKKRQWWGNVSHGVIDVAGTQHHGSRSAEEVWRAGGVRLLSKKIKVEDSIDRVRSVLRSDGDAATPRLRVHPKCKGLISEMGAGPSPFEGRGPWTYKMDREGNIVSDIPDDKNNDACKALAYGLVHSLGYVERPPKTDGPVYWTTPQGPSWLRWADPLDKQEPVHGAVSGAKYLCQARHRHNTPAQARECNANTN